MSKRCTESGCAKRARREVLGLGQLCGEHAKRWEKEGSWAPEVIADSSGKWCGNALRFATEAEAKSNVRDLMMRWMSVRDTRVVRSRDPVNYLWVPSQGGLVSVERAQREANNAHGGAAHAALEASTAKKEEV